MRATISFDVGLEKVEDTMCVLVGQESSSLRVAATILERADSGTLLEEVSEALDLLHAATVQLQQYKDMMISFQRARFETMLPQEVDSGNQTPPASLPADELRRLEERSKNMVEFNRFLGGISSASRDTEFKKLDESPSNIEEEE